MSWGSAGRAAGAARCPSCATESTSGEDTTPAGSARFDSAGAACATARSRRTTTRLRAALAVAVEDGRARSRVAAAHRLSWPMVQHAVVVHGAVELAEPGPTTVLGMVPHALHPAHPPIVSEEPDGARPRSKSRHGLDVQVIADPAAD